MFLHKETGARITFETEQTLAGMQMIIKNKDANAVPALDVTSDQVLQDVKVEIILQYDGNQETIYPKRSLEELASSSGWGEDTIHALAFTDDTGYVKHTLQWSAGELGQAVYMGNNARYIVNIYSDNAYEFEVRGIKNPISIDYFRATSSLVVNTSEPKEQFILTEKGQIVGLTAPVSYDPSKMDYKILVTYQNGEDVELTAWELLDLSLRQDKIHLRAINAQRRVEVQTSNKYVVLPLFGGSEVVRKLKITNNTGEKIEFLQTTLKRV